VTGQYREPRTTTTVSVTVTPPTGPARKTTTSIGLNDYFSLTLPPVASGPTKVSFAVGKAKAGTVTVHGYPAAAPSIAALSAHAGPATGGRKLAIAGAHFSGAAGVMFGPPSSRHAGTSLKIVSATTLTVVTPADAGAGYVTVTTARGGPSGLTGRAVYNFLNRPAVTALSPGSGPAGTTVTITGTGFGYVKAVHFGSALATQLHVVSGRTVTVVAPPGTGTVNVTVTTAGGTSAVSSAGQYAY
jgi:hypothetical protein